MKRLLLAILLLVSSKGWCASSNTGIGFGSSVLNNSRNFYFQSANAYSQVPGHLFTTTCVQAAVSARNSVCQLVNPSGSSVVMVVNTFRCWLGTAGLAQLTVNNTARTTLIGGGTPLNLGGGGTSSGQVYQDTIASLGTALSTYNVGTTPASGVMAVGQYIVLGAGSGLEVEVQTVNIQLNCEFYWYERPPA